MVIARRELGRAAKRAQAEDLATPEPAKAAS
jgi:hypothetical protein